MEVFLKADNLNRITCNYIPKGFLYVYYMSNLDILFSCL